MGRDHADTRPHLKTPGWTVVVGLLVVAVAAVPGFLPAQEDDDSDTPVMTETRPGDPGDYQGWGDVDFPHDFHIDDLELECEECHHETNALRLKMPHEDYFDDFWIDCTICHKSDSEVSLDPQSCSECHPSNPKNSADETLSAKVVIHQNCWNCHDSGTGSDAAETCSFCHDGPSVEN